MKTVVVKSTNKDEAYVATVLLFNNIQMMAANNVGSWELVESYTDCENCEFITKYSNGKMWINAYTIDNNHEYSFGEVAK